MSARIVVACAQCGKEKTILRRLRRARPFCNARCQSAFFRGGQPARVTVNCAHCGKAKATYRVFQRPTNFCDRDCYDAHRTKYPDRPVPATIGKRRADDPHYAARDAARDPYDPEAFDRAILLERQREQRLLAAYDDEAEIA
jgi:endogenous inhibitor of DNA gyrase (YacG/DUF329 family)